MFYEKTLLLGMERKIYRGYCLLSSEETVWLRVVSVTFDKTEKN